MKYLRKAASLIISILIILSVFGGIAAADPNAAEIEFIENIIPITKISDDEADETEKKQTLFEKIKAGILRMLHPSSLKEARNNVAEGGIRQLLRPSPLSGMPNWVASPDYGALTVVEITTEQELLDNILNALGTREVVSGNRVNKTTFLLTDNFTVNASELSNTYFSAFTGPNTATLFSNIDGNGKTITIVVDTPNPARPLLNRVNDFNNINMGDRLFVRDLTVRYIGDVKTSPFANGDILFCDLENITIVVEGDIVGDYRLWEQPGVWGQTARTFGFADHISTLSDEPLIMRNISITAQTIGYVQGKTPENASNGEWLGVVNGFATNTPVQTTLENITVNYARMDGTTTSGHIEVSGFAWRINGAADNIRVNIGEIYIRPSNSVNPDGTTTVRGLGDSTYISNSTFNVSGNITMEHLEVASPSAVVGNILFYGLGELRLQSNSAYFYNNSINIAGNLTAEGPSATWIAGLMDYQQSWNTANNAVAINNSVTVGGNMESRSVRKIPTNTYFGSSQSIVVGMYAGISESVNNTLTVGGNMTSYCAGGNSFLFGHSRGLTNLRSNIQGSTTDIGGIMSSVTVSGAPTLMGINSGNLNNHDRNRLIVRNVFGAPDAMYAETQNSSASVNLQGYGMTPTAGMPVSSVTNNSVIINGNMTGKAPGAVRIGGFAYSATNLAAGSVVSDNIVRVDGRIQSLSDTENAQTAGFVTFANRETANNVVYARDGVWGAGNPAGFSLSANDNAQIRGNTWLGRPGEIVPTTPETRADYRNFIITPADSDNAGNFYTSVLEGQRISNELVYNGTTLLWEPISVERRPLLEVSSRTDNSSSQIYIIAKDAGVGTLGLAGPDASKASLAGNNLTMPAGSIVLLTAVEGGKTVVKDIAGIGHVYSHGNVTGNIFWDGNNNGVKDAGEAVADIEVKAYYRDGEVTSNQTDSNGDYIIQIPLLAVINPEIVLEMEIPEGYHSSNHSNNDFTSLNQLRFNLNWTVPVSGQIGILAGGSSPPIVPPGGGGGNGTGNGTVNNSTPPGGNGSDNGTPPGGNGSDNGTPPGGGGGPEEIGVFLILLIFALAVAFFIFRKKREIDEEDKHLEDSANNQQK